MLKKIRSNYFINRVFRNAIRFFLRFTQKIRIRWQVAGVIDLTFANQKFKMFTQCDDNITNALFYEQDYVESSDLQLFIDLAKSSNTVIDIGANTGIYTILTALSNPNCKLLAFEPHPNNYKRLTKNLEINQIKNVQAFQQAVGNQESFINFYIPDNEAISDTSSALESFSKSTYKGQINWKSIDVAQTSLDSLCQKNQFDSIDLMKIDVEGYEINVFKGANEFFNKYKPIIFCEIFLNDEKREFFQNFIQKYDYTPYLLLKEGLLRLDNGLAVNYDGLNFLFSQNRTTEIFTSFKSTSNIVEELKKNKSA